MSKEVIFSSRLAGADFNPSTKKKEVGRLFRVGSQPRPGQDLVSRKRAEHEAV